MMIAPSSAEIAGRRAVIGSGCWVTWAASTSADDCPVNGGDPVSSS